MSVEYKSQFLNQVGVRCFNVPGAGESLAEQGHLSNAITVPTNAAVVHITGQVGNRENGEVPSDFREEFLQVFVNVETVLKAAGVHEGWEAVYKVHFLNLDNSPERLQEYLANIKKFCKDSRPTTMAIGASSIAWTGATIEIFVEAVKKAS
ncbi:NADP-specific glutamate dehydrogenase [Fonsecaea nubica]|uniref:NADP-specific glutamate dehydrogenase n=1 Tax=Fonsecaea nubica TaxID=856822 RepID=A0A178BVM7_9EURO|nr:NADP-specific glutamate dehydrogenase [Fonsecaea nubica]OAL20935.1 NADP-specific glutamate dehydrogenase [Fonsecaea nubica]